jgi:hypothetical protein
MVLLCFIVYQFGIPISQTRWNLVIIAIKILKHKINGWNCKVETFPTYINVAQFFFEYPWKICTFYIKLKGWKWRRRVQRGRQCAVTQSTTNGAGRELTPRLHLYLFYHELPSKYAKCLGSCRGHGLASLRKSQRCGHFARAIGSGSPAWPWISPLFANRQVGCWPS